MNMNTQVKQNIGNLIVLKFCKYLTSNIKLQINNKESDISWRIIIMYHLRMYINKCSTVIFFLKKI